MPSGRAERRRLARKVERRRRRTALREIPLMVGVALGIALLLKTFLVQAFVIPSGSMENTIRVQDRVLVDKLTPWFGAAPERGDVVVFRDPGGWLQGESAPAPGDDPVGVKQIKQALTFVGLLPSGNQRDLIKRVVAVGGDTVRCCGADGRVSVNGVPLDEPYLKPGEAPSTVSFEVKVAPGRLFVLGDHRSHSADSRFHLGDGDQGTISEDQVVGRAVVIAWPVGHWRRLAEPETFDPVPAVDGSVAGTERSTAAAGGTERSTAAGGSAEEVPPPGRNGITQGYPSGDAQGDRSGDARGDSAVSSPASHRLSSQDRNGMVLLPTLAELPLVMGVVGLLLLRGRRFARSEEWMWGTWRSAHGPGTSSRRTGPGSPSTPLRPCRAMSPRAGRPPSRKGPMDPTGASGRRDSGPSGRSCRS
ncbi:signal peptidase I [Streptomyces sp. NPDC000594]|uniref:signal peptidase I n=1 Tax=Streptomyces sp. NPDC000594 TaxID=3154261 RepID=UPI0033259C75